jgi:hypothetical protein
MEEHVISHVDKDAEGEAVENAHRMLENGFDRRLLRRRLETIPVDVREKLAKRSGPGVLWWYGPRSDEQPDVMGWHFTRMQADARWAKPFTPHPDVPVTLRGNAERAIWIPLSPSAVNEVTIELCGRQRFWRLTMNRALDLQVNSTEYLATMNLGESLRMLMGVLGEVNLREIGDSE